MSTAVQELAPRVEATMRRDTGSWLYRPLLQLLVGGRPITLDDLAETTGRPVDQVRQGLAELKDIEYNRAGKIVGQGLTLRPTRHRFEVDGRQLYTWCALDTLMYPVILARSARVSSPCQATGTPVQVTVEPDQVTSVEPGAAVVSIVTPENPTSIRAAFCENVHYFVNPSVAQDWLGEHPGASLLSVADAFALSRIIFA
jgi:alkylmercury lyase